MDKKVETDLRQRAEKFSIIFQKTQFPVALTRVPRGEFVDVNEAFERLSGFSRDEVLGRTAVELGIVPEESSGDMIRAELLEKGVVRRRERRVRLKSGEERLVLVNSDVVELGGERYALSTTEDITEARAYEQQLSEQARLLDLSNDAIIMRDAEDRITYWNHGAEEMYGYARAEALGRVSHELLQTRFPAELKEIQAQVAGRGRWSGELVHTRKDGSQIFTFSRWVADRDSAGAILSVLETNNDISQRKKAEEALRESEERLRLFIRHAPAALAMFDRQMCYLAASDRWKQDYGLQGELAGRSHYEIFPELPERWKEVHQRALAGEVLQANEDCFPRADGTVQWLKWQVRPWRLVDGNVGGVLMAAEDVTARMVARRALEESEQRYRATFENAAIGIAHVGLDGRWLRFNEAICRITGYSREELATKSFEEITHPEDVKADKAQSERVRLGEIPTYSLEKRYIRKDGSIIWVNLTVSMLHDREGKPLNFISVVEDIDVRKRAEAELRQSEERFRELGENIPQLAWMTNPDGWIFWYNRRWFEYTGTTLEQMQGWGWQAVHHPDHLARVTEHFKVALATGEPWEDTFPLRGRDGQYRWFLSRAFPIRDSQDQIIRWFGTNTDITELRQAQEQLAQREWVLRTVTSEARVGLVMVGKNRQYLFANQTYTEILGLAETDLVGKLVPEVLAHLYEQIGPHLDQAFAGNRVVYELHLARHPKTGDERYYEVVYEPRLEDPGNAYVVVVIVDITHRKFTQQNLERTVAERTAELRKTIEELEAFSYSVSHDMRGPLRAMTSYAGIIKEEFGNLLPEQAREYLASIASAATRMDQLITDVLAYSRVSRARRNLEPISLEPFLAEIIAHYPTLKPECADITIEGPLPTVLGDQPSLAQCVSNLLTNAAKFVPPGKKPAVRIWAEPVADDGHPARAVRVSFQDNGIGIPAKDLGRIFRIFERLNPQSAYEGTGIGLAIVKKAVERMGGQVGVESTPGQGSRFWIELQKA